MLTYGGVGGGTYGGAGSVITGTFSGTGALTGGTAQFSDGAAATPSISFASDTNTGFYKTTGGILELSIGGAQSFRWSANGFFFAQASGNFVLSSGGQMAWSSGTAGSAGSDTGFSRDGVGIVALKNANAAMESRVYAGNGGFMALVKTVNESLTIAAAATTVSATSIPAGAILLAVSPRVTTVIPTAATFTLTTTVGGATLNTAAVSSAANSTDPGTAAGASYRAAATTVTITPNLQPAAATGVVRLTFYYIQVTPPTS